jgi:hypothetical protein
MLTYVDDVNNNAGNGVMLNGINSLIIIEEQRTTRTCVEIMSDD